MIWREMYGNGQWKLITRGVESFEEADYGTTGINDPASIRSYGSYTTERSDKSGFRVALVLK